MLDKETYQAKRQNLLLRQQELRDRQAEQSDFKEKSALIEPFLELVKNLSRLYAMALPNEKCQMVDLAFSNLTVWAKNIAFTPRDWLVAVGSGEAVLCGAHCRDGNRNSQQLGEPAIRDVSDVLDCQEIHALLKLHKAVD